MATLTSTACQTNASGFFLAPPKYNEKGVQCRTALYTFTANQSAGDVIQMVPVPKSAVIVELNVNWQLGGGAVTANIGDGNSTGRFAASMSSNVANVQRATNGLGYSYSAEDTIDIVVGTATSATNGAAITVRLSAFYILDNAQDGGT